MPHVHSMGQSNFSLQPKKEDLNIMTYERQGCNVSVSQGNERISLSRSGVIFRHSNRRPVSIEVKALMLSLVCEELRA